MEFEDPHRRRAALQEVSEEMLMNHNNNRVEVVQIAQQTPPPLTSVKPVRYGTCMKNNGIRDASVVLDGCCEFIAAEALKCAACGCHRSFHRRDDATDPPPVPFMILTHYQPPLRPPSTPAPQPPGSVTLAAADPANNGASKQASAGLRKTFRSRTSFTPSQKASMKAMAEKIKWKLPKCSEEMVQHFCQEIDVGKRAFRVWIHNHKPKGRMTSNESSPNTTSGQHQPQN